MSLASLSRLEITPSEKQALAGFELKYLQCWPTAVVLSHVQHHSRIDMMSCLIIFQV